MRLPVNRFAALTLTTLLFATAAHAGDKRAVVLAPTSGPAADYPMVLGDPFVVDGVTYTPQDKLNFDQVGYAGVGGGTGISIAHRTLPMPSYAEVTSLDSGRTILVRVTRRGPMDGPNIVDLSPDAAAQLGVTASRTAIRIRRVNPPEAERAALRDGRAAPLRMDTPQSLVAVLRRKLDPAAAPVLLPLPKVIGAAVTPPIAANPPVPTSPRVSTPKATPVAATPKPAPNAAPVQAAAPPQKAPPAAKSSGSLVVQIGAFSSEARSNEIARKLGAGVAPAGKLFRVRMGPFTSRGQAEAALAKAKAAGYSEARIQTAS
ncbi:SPOR domain-containing protein [Novosphingobium sp.]|uniref:SPOR domain-containing protein n=1 Tax=Novosphingobium sp. TaxID=1874826 RepID=UPI00286DCD1D|nr:SPOR domain-containing protein [Novosphingobium sp.]